MPYTPAPSWRHECQSCQVRPFSSLAGPDRSARLSSVSFWTTTNPIASSATPVMSSSRTNAARCSMTTHVFAYVVHAAALQQVDTAEYNPWEFVKTNVIGSQNVIEACIDAGVKKVVALSTDCLLYTSPSPRDRQKSRMPSSA